MNALDRLLIGCIVAVGVLMAGGHELKRYGADKFAAGQAAAVAAGQVQHDRDAATAHKTESDLRAQLAMRDADAYQKEKTYASNLEAAQRRVRAGVDSLRCPAASPIPAGAAADSRPAAAGLVVEPAGPSLMPEAADDLLGVAADVAGLVRRYERLQQRFEACRAVNAGP